MTKQERLAERVLGFLKRYAAEHDGMAPSYREIAAGAGVGLGRVSRLLEILQADGKIRYLSNRARAIEVIQGVFMFDSKSGKIVPLHRFVIDTAQNRRA